MDAGGRATQEAKAKQVFVLTRFWHAPEVRSLPRV